MSYQFKLKNIQELDIPYSYRLMYDKVKNLEV